MTKHPADSSIIATFGWPHSIEYILGHFRKAGTPTTAAHIEHVWESAKAANKLPPLTRPAEGFDLRDSAFVQTLAKYGQQVRHG
jgi:hypothetical protein